MVFCVDIGSYLGEDINRNTPVFFSKEHGQGLMVKIMYLRYKLMSLMQMFRSFMASEQLKDTATAGDSVQ